MYVCHVLCESIIDVMIVSFFLAQKYKAITKNKANSLYLGTTVLTSKLCSLFCNFCCRRNRLSSDGSFIPAGVAL